MSISTSCTDVLGFAVCQDVEICVQSKAHTTFNYCKNFSCGVEYLEYCSIYIGIHTCIMINDATVIHLCRLSPQVRRVSWCHHSTQHSGNVPSTRNTLLITFDRYVCL